MNIKGKKVTLRAIEADDLPLLHEWSNNPEINYMLGGWHFPSSKLEQESWHKSLSFRSVNQRFSIVTEELGLIGMVNLVDINWKDRNAFTGMLLGNKQTRGQGYGIDTIMAINRYAFEELNFMRLDTTMISYNETSIGVYTKKCGWSVEAIKKNYYFRRNQWWDQVVAGITRDDYFKLIDSNHYWQND
jgi:RimJ/RimL family protein N-acetyltransferase